MTEVKGLLSKEFGVNLNGGEHIMMTAHSAGGMAIMNDADSESSPVKTYVFLDGTFDEALLNRSNGRSDQYGDIETDADVVYVVRKGKTTHKFAKQLIEDGMNAELRIVTGTRHEDMIRHELEEAILEVAKQ